MSTQKCIVCCKEPKDVKSWVSCPQAEGFICMSHCMKCKNFDDSTSWIHCSYSTNLKNKKEHEKNTLL
ncbi:hypothetical protein [Clostridium sp. YIM B02551]|uniref:hypothetical protein n=1 Tax=Clostridium sp. YIM B02551 TaxID=2910679 RepID=UPI001EEA69BE|nr:hypothetical protein [Clostridium sp. YIM B02551]